MPQRMDAGKQGGGEVTAGLAIVLIGAFFLAVSLFFDRADDYFYEVANNRLIEYGAVGPVLATLIIGSIGICLLGFIDRFPRLGLFLLLLTSIACLALTVFAANDIGVHPTDMGDQPNEMEAGSLFSIASSMLMVGGALFAIAFVWRQPRR